MKTSTVLVLGLSAAVLLAGCNGPGGSPEPDGTSTPPGGSASAATSFQPGSPDPTPGALRHFTAAELEAVATDIAASHQGARVINESQIAELAPLAEDVLAGMDISPAACAVFLDASIADQLDRAELAGVTIPGNADGEETSINLASFAEEALLDEDQNQSAAMLEKCSEFTLDMGGAEVVSKVVELEASTSASATAANATTILAGGQELTTVTVTARDGHVLVTGAVVGGSGDLEASLAAAEEATEAGLEALRAR